MKHNYIKPETIVEELTVVTMFATSGNRIPVNNTPSTPAANERRGGWGDLWE